MNVAKRIFVITLICNIGTWFFMLPRRDIIYSLTRYMWLNVIIHLILYMSIFLILKNISIKLYLGHHFKKVYKSLWDSQYLYPRQVEFDLRKGKSVYFEYKLSEYKSIMFIVGVNKEGFLEFFPMGMAKPFVLRGDLDFTMSTFTSMSFRPDSKMIVAKESFLLFLMNKGYIDLWI
jgi:hypothetical protein